MCFVCLFHGCVSSAWILWKLYVQKFNAYLCCVCMFLGVNHLVELLWVFDLGFCVVFLSKVLV